MPENKQYEIETKNAMRDYEVIANKQARVAIDKQIQDNLFKLKGIADNLRNLFFELKFQGDSEVFELFGNH